MGIGALDSAIFADMFGTAAMREAFGDDAFLARCVEVEAALARAQGKLGIIPAEAAAAITHIASSLAAGREALDLARLKNETETVGYPILPLVRQLAEFASAAGRYLHWGATTQDIMDTAAVLQIRAGLALIEEDLTATRSHLAALARKYRDTPMAGRTHLQHALPVTFGYKAAVWLYALDRHADRLRELRPRVLLAQFGGAAGTLASLGNGEEALKTRAELARELGLGDPAITWHVEWVALPEAFGYAAGALHQARFMLGGLIVDAGRMAKNLAMTHGLIVAEAVMMGLAPHTGRNEAHDLVYDACRAAIETDRPLLDVLMETPAVAAPLGAEKLRALTDPTNYLGAAPAMVDRLLAGR